jgi:8-oxo-dGTP pyrophosphatase MutT (NUDIX family)
METNLHPTAKPPRAAATVVMLRDGPEGLEVFLLQRHGLSDVLGGAYVFPGGKVDLADAELDMETHLDQTLSALHSALGEKDLDARDAAGLYVAALREAFEECGVLFAQGRQARALNATAAQGMLREGHAFDEVLQAMELQLQTRAILPWSRWITPVVSSVMNKRFDTRFFVAAMPDGQTAQHDNRETTGSIWLRPRTALEQYRDRLIDLAPPQIMSLAHLSRHATVQSVMDAARSRLPPVIQPEPFDQEGVRVLCYPGDARHPVGERALPGPTRLLYRNQRFEPADGFEALFA